MTETIAFNAVVYKVQTLVDNGIRVTLDLPETAVMQAAQLMECQRFGAVLDVLAEPGILTDLDDAVKESAERGGPELGRRRSTNRRDQRAGN